MADSLTTFWSTKWMTTTIFICVNASNQEKDFDHINLMNRHEGDRGVRFRALRADRRAGPESARNAAEADADAARSPSSITGSWTAKLMASGRASRAPATPGEDGFEIYVAPERAEAIWDKLLDAGRGIRNQALRSWARETRCGWKPKWRFTDTRSARVSRRSKRTSAGS